MNVAQTCAEIFKREGVEYLMCYPLNPLTESCAAVGIRPIIVRQERVAGRTRRYYRLTDHGVQALHREAARMEQAARVVTRRSGSAATTPGLA